MKKILAFLLAFTPGVAPIMLGKYKLGLYFVIIFWIAGWSYRALGLLGPAAFFAGIVIFLSVWAFLIAFSVRDILKSDQSPKLSHGILAWVAIVIFTSVGVRNLSPGNIFEMGPDDSMGDVIKTNEYFYVAQLKPSIKFGDVVTYQSERGTAVGIVCALGGDKLEIKGSQVIRNERPTDCGHNEFVRQTEIDFGPYDVPGESFFLLKPNGLDSSITGSAVPVSAVNGRMVFKLVDVPFGNALAGFYRLF